MKNICTTACKVSDVLHRLFLSCCFLLSLTRCTAPLAASLLCLCSFIVIVAVSLLVRRHRCCLSARSSSSLLSFCSSIIILAVRFVRSCLPPTPDCPLAPFLCCSFVVIIAVFLLVHHHRCCLSARPSYICMCLHWIYALLAQLFAAFPLAHADCRFGKQTEIGFFYFDGHLRETLRKIEKFNLTN